MNREKLLKKITGLEYFLGSCVYDLFGGKAYYYEGIVPTTTNMSRSFFEKGIDREEIPL